MQQRRGNAACVPDGFRPDEESGAANQWKCAAHNNPLRFVQATVGLGWR